MNLSGQDTFSYPGAIRARDSVFDLLPAIGRECAYSFYAKYDAKRNMIATAVLGALTTAIGPLYLFKPPGRNPHPISSWSMSVGPSGSGKTDLYRDLAKPFHLEQERRRAYMAHATQEYDQALAQWKDAIDSVKRQQRRKNISAAEINSLKLDLDKLQRNKPSPPKERPLIVDDFDHESFMAIANGRNEALTIFPDEADRVLNGRWFHNRAPVFNEIHDGVSAPVYRREKKPPLEAIETHLSFNLFVREASLDQFKPIYKGGEVKKAWLVDLGFLARFRVSIDDTQAKKTGLYRPQDPDACIEELQIKLQSRAQQHNEHLLIGGWKQVVLELEDEAVAYWNELVTEVKRLRENDWANNEFGGKALFHLGSVASTLHVAESDSKFVSLQAVRRGWHLVCLFAQMYELAFAPPPPATRMQKDYAKIMEYLQMQWGRINYAAVDLTHMGYMLGISKQRVLAVVHSLVHDGHALFNRGMPTSMDVTPMVAPTRHNTYR